MRRLAIALVHHPVLDKAGDVVTTAMTNLDLHDMSRSARTYGLQALFVAHPIEAQRELVNRICSHWVHGSGKKRIPDRAVALELVRTTVGLEQVYEQLGGRAAVEVWTTAASARGAAVATFADGRARLEAPDERSVLILFGTGWGLAPSVIASADMQLAPIQKRGVSDYNHLSVRAACAITLDRLLGER